MFSMPSIGPPLFLGVDAVTLPDFEISRISKCAFLRTVHAGGAHGHAWQRHALDVVPLGEKLVTVLTGTWPLERRS